MYFVCVCLHAVLCVSSVLYWRCFPFPPNKQPQFDALMCTQTHRDTQENFAFHAIYYWAPMYVRVSERTNESIVKYHIASMNHID